MAEKLSWKVFRHNVNKDEIEAYDIFSSYAFCADLITIKKKCVEFDIFAEAVRSSLRSHFWSRCEWEVIVGAWVGGTAEEKIDAYGQIIMNWDIFISYLWANRNLITKKNLGLER